MPRWLRGLLRRVQDLAAARLPRPVKRILKTTREAVFVTPFVLDPRVPNFTLRTRFDLARRFVAISDAVDCPHTNLQMLAVVRAMLALPTETGGCLVEAGCYKGGSTAKLSLVARLLGKKLVVFDSFQGLPPNQEDHDTSVLGHSIEDWFAGGAYCGTLDEVRSNVERYGDLASCEFRQGWFDNTMPDFTDDVCAAFIDVDLASSTETCLRHLYPNLTPGGFIYSHDGDFPLVIEVFEDEALWDEISKGAEPEIFGLGEKKMIKVVKSRPGG